MFDLMILIFEYFQPNYSSIKSDQFFQNNLPTYYTTPPTYFGGGPMSLSSNNNINQLQFTNPQKTNLLTASSFNNPNTNIPSSVSPQPKFSFLDSKSQNAGNLENVAKKTALVGGTLGGAAILHALSTLNFGNSEGDVSDISTNAHEDTKTENQPTNIKIPEKTEVNPKLQSYPSQKSVDVSSNPNYMISGATPVPPSYVQHYPQNNLQPGNSSIMIPDRGGTPFRYSYTPYLGDSFSHVPNQRVFRTPGSIY